MLCYLIEHILISIALSIKPSIRITFGITLDKKKNSEWIIQSSWNAKY